MSFGLISSYGDWDKAGLAKTATRLAGVYTPAFGEKTHKYYAIGVN